MDKKKALQYYTLAAEQGNAAAQYNCGLMYYEGYGTEIDFAEALKWFERSAAQGQKEAQEAVAVLQDAIARR